MIATLEAAYRATLYQIDAEPPIAVRIGDADPALDHLLSSHGVDNAAILTAWNPMSIQTPPASNAAAQAALAARLRDLGLAVLPGIGTAPDGRWRENHLVAFGLTHSQAGAFGRAFRQNAFVWIARGASPALVWTTP